MGLKKKMLFGNKPSEWAAWLSDDPPPPTNTQASPHRTVRPSVDTARERLRQAGMRHGVSLAQANTQPRPSGAISILINLPKIRVPKVALPWRSIRYWSIFALVVIVFGLGSRALLGMVWPKNPAKQPIVTTQAKPTFAPLMSAKKQTTATDAQTPTQYDEKKNLLSFPDKILSADVTVSQQPAPASFKENPAKILAAADSIGAKDKIDTALGQAYIATDAKSGVQRVMLVHNDLLVFIQSSKKLDNETWKYYIETLR